MLDDPTFTAKMASLERRHGEVSSLLADPETFSRPDKLAKLSKEHADLTDVVGAWRELLRLGEELAEARVMAEEAQGDPEMRQLAREETARLEQAAAAAEGRLKLLLLPQDPNDAKNTLLEIRAGTGGDEAALFAGDLFRMYLRFAETRGWKTEVMNIHEGQAGGVKEVILLVTGKAVYSQLKYESGVHRVQRVPATESQGRIHTSAATVAVLPEAEEVDVTIDPGDLRVDVMRAGGPGGQSVNTTDSAVRLTHIPSGIVVICQDEKSQHKNKAKALRILRSRVLDREIAKQQAAERAERQALVKTGDRSEKIRTYNFPQDRVTDHRLGLTKHNLPGILDGDLGDIIDALRAHDQAEALQRAES